MAVLSKVVAGAALATSVWGLHIVRKQEPVADAAAIVAVAVAKPKPTAEGWSAEDYIDDGKVKGPVLEVGKEEPPKEKKKKKSRHNWHIEDVSCASTFTSVCADGEFCYKNLAASFETGTQCMRKFKAETECGVFDSVYFGMVCENVDMDGKPYPHSCQPLEGDSPGFSDGHGFVGDKPARCLPCCDREEYESDEDAEKNCRKTDAGERVPDCPLHMDVDNNFLVMHADTTVCVGGKKGDEIKSPGEMFDCPEGDIKLKEDLKETCVSLKEFDESLSAGPIPMFTSDGESAEDLIKGEMRAAALKKAGLCPGGEKKDGADGDKKDSGDGAGSDKKDGGDKKDEGGDKKDEGGEKKDDGGDKKDGGEKDSGDGEDGGDSEGDAEAPAAKPEPKAAPKPAAKAAAKPAGKPTAKPSGKAAASAAEAAAAAASKNVGKFPAAGQAIPKTGEPTGKDAAAAKAQAMNAF